MPSAEKSATRYLALRDQPPCGTGTMIGPARLPNDLRLRIALRGSALKKKEGLSRPTRLAKECRLPERPIQSELSVQPTEPLDFC